jgi:transcriptional regulator with XRE-family HTH domain
LIVYHIFCSAGGTKYIDQAIRIFPVKNNLIGQQIKLARQLHKPRLTQSELATRLQLDGCDINRNSVAKIEMGLRQVTDVEVFKLAKVLNVSIEWLFSGKE